MARYYKKSNIRYLSDVKSGIEHFDSDKIDVDDSGEPMIIDIWDESILTFDDKSATDNPSFTLTINGVDVATGNLKIYYGDVALEVIEDDNFLFLKLGPDGNNNMEKTIYVIELKNGNNTYISYKSYNANLGFDYYNVENMSFSNLDGSFTNAIKAPMFSYEARTGYLDFISHSSFVSGGTKVFVSTDIYDCTTVNFGDTLSLKDGANFLAIGANSMVQLDEEGS